MTTEAIASAFLLGTPASAQRIVRAKAKIKAAGIPYEVPDEASRTERLSSVLRVVYLVFNEGQVSHNPILLDESIRLARLLRQLMPEPEVLGLHLSFDGNTREVFAFYEKTLGGKIKAMWSYDDMPATDTPDAGCNESQMPSGEGIMHACLELPGGAMLMAGDTPPGMPCERISGVMIALQFDSNDQATETFHALAQGGQVTMPLSPTFWAKNFGMLTDQFGVSWAAEPLHGTHTATTVRVRNGELTVFDGPFAETKDMLAGIYLIDAKDLNEAIQVAAGIPPAKFGSVEVRPDRATGEAGRTKMA